MLTANRQIKWLASNEAGNAVALAALQSRMATFYAETPAYYEEIQYTAAAWSSEPTYFEIMRSVRTGTSVLEVGCGRANILSAQPDLRAVYTGVDFSAELLIRNSHRFPDARFVPITTPQKLPLPDASFDRVFCTYVIEHCVYPQLFLRECLRVLRPGGQFLLYCPNFLGRGVMPSQRAGYSLGNGREKLRRGNLLDALTTGYDRKVRIPWAAHKARQSSRSGRGGFWINPAPTCFRDPFYPDADAVYLTYDWEIIQELHRGGAEILKIGADPNRIFLVAQLKVSTL